MGTCNVSQGACQPVLDFFFQILFYFYYYYFLLYNTVLVLPYINMNLHGCTHVPNLNPPPTSLPIPSLWIITGHQPQASCILHQT